MPKFNKGDMVMLNPDIGEDDFRYGKSIVDYGEMGYVQQACDNGYVRVNWPNSYGGNWGGHEDEIILVENEE